jgi:hypothetical protein
MSVFFGRKKPCKNRHRKNLRGLLEAVRFNFTQPMAKNLEIAILLLKISFFLAKWHLLSDLISK